MDSAIESVFEGSESTASGENLSFDYKFISCNKMMKEKILLDEKNSWKSFQKPAAAAKCPKIILHHFFKSSPFPTSKNTRNDLWFLLTISHFLVCSLSLLWRGSYNTLGRRNAVLIEQFHTNMLVDIQITDCSNDTWSLT